MPEYWGQPGTVVFGGALPPPQSKGSQSSPVPGTYQATEAPAGEVRSVVVQPVRSVLAETEVVRMWKRRSEREELIREGILACL